MKLAHVGFLEALEEEGIKPDYISGCSMGAVVGGCYASGMSVAEMKETVLALRMRDILDVTPAVITKMSILRGRKVLDLLIKHQSFQKADVGYPARTSAAERKSQSFTHNVSFIRKSYTSVVIFRRAF